jgi:hypothetical protein
MVARAIQEAQANSSGFATDIGKLLQKITNHLQRSHTAETTPQLLQQVLTRAVTRTHVATVRELTLERSARNRRTKTLRTRSIRTASRTILHGTATARFGRRRSVILGRSLKIRLRSAILAITLLQELFTDRFRTHLQSREPLVDPLGAVTNANGP